MAAPSQHLWIGESWPISGTGRDRSGKPIDLSLYKIELRIAQAGVIKLSTDNEKDPTMFAVSGSKWAVMIDDADPVQNSFVAGTATVEIAIIDPDTNVQITGHVDIDMRMSLRAQEIRAATP